VADIQRHNPVSIEAFFVMKLWRNLHQLAPAASQSPSAARRVPMRHSRPIEVDGVFLGAAVEHELGVRFIAVDVRVTAMDRSIWPTLGHVYRSARQLFKSGRLATSPQGS
jgi:hypothetical protein